MANERRMRNMYPALYTLTLIGKGSAIIGGLIGLIVAAMAWAKVNIWAGLSVVLTTAYVVFIVWVATELIGLLVDLVYHAHNIEIATKRTEAQLDWMRDKLKERLETADDDASGKKSRKTNRGAEAPSLYSE